jgi:DNA-binding NtrC family response regulator
MKKKILIIDDCLPILNSLRLILELHHYEVEITQNGACLPDTNDALPDILLVDYHIPDIDGFKMIKKLKASMKHIPVILMSGNRDIERVSTLLGVTDFISKPINLDELLNKIVRCISTPVVLTLS